MQREAEQRDMARYFFSILHVERRFAADAQMREVVRNRLEHASFRAEHFASHVGEVCHSVAGVYQDTFSRLPRAHQGDGQCPAPENGENADIVRSLLLAGVRSAYLWRQLGGGAGNWPSSAAPCCVRHRTCPAAWASSSAAPRQALKGTARNSHGRLKHAAATHGADAPRWPLRRQDP
jgi:hypothetical protein